MGSPEAGNTRLRSARQALGLRSATAARERGHPRWKVDRAPHLDHSPHRAALGIRRAAMAASRSPGRR